MSNAYETYLRSDHWKNLRLKAIDRWGDHCCNCNVPGVDVHHLRYGNLLDVTTDDLIPLCRRCHEAVHSSVSITTLWTSNTPSCEKRISTVAFLSGRDEVLRQKTVDYDQFKARVAREKRDESIAKTVRLSYHEAQAVVGSRDEIRWLYSAGYRPNSRGWKARIAGRRLPESIFARYKQY